MESRNLDQEELIAELMSSPLTQNGNWNSLNSLNDDILMQIFDHFHLDDKVRLRRTCRRWKALLNLQLTKAKALRIGLFNQGGFSVTSGLRMPCIHQATNQRRQTGTLAGKPILSYPVDLETSCHTLQRYDYLHRALKQCHSSITILSLGRINISYRLLMVIANNLPNLEHMEIISCASDLSNDQRKKSVGDISCKINDASVPSLESFNTYDPRKFLYATQLYNQNNDERVNMEERIYRASMVKSCDLVQQSKRRNYWPNLRHLLVKDCNLLNEFSLSLIVAITSQTLVYLVVESSQYLTGEFLNYCGPKLKILKVRYCPLLQVKFIEELVKIKQILSPTTQDSSYNSNYQDDLNRSSSHQPPPFNSSIIRNYRDPNQEIYCTL